MIITLNKLQITEFTTYVASANVQFEDKTIQRLLSICKNNLHLRLLKLLTSTLYARVVKKRFKLNEIDVLILQIIFKQNQCTPYLQIIEFEVLQNAPIFKN